jgi:hypothetical protein
MKRSMKAGAVLVGAAAALGLMAAPASAITRVGSSPGCSSTYFQVLSNATTCWAYAGTANVTLYSVWGLSSGNNTGYIQGHSSTRSYLTYAYVKNAQTSVPGETVTVVHIN